MKLIDYSINNPVFSNLLMATIIIFGLYVGFNLPKELFPSVGFEKVTILTIHENSTAEDVEKLITSRNLKPKKRRFFKNYIYFFFFRYSVRSFNINYSYVRNEWLQDGIN